MTNQEQVSGEAVKDLDVAVDRLTVVPISLADANRYVGEHHRHSNPVTGHKFSLAAAMGDEICGVAIVGRPVARGLQDGWTLEVLRNCSTGTKNVCSFLYGACWRATRAMGYRKLITYTLKSESGASLRASGWRVVGEVKARSWDTPSRPRVDKHEIQERLRWELTTSPPTNTPEKKNES